jgi:hypothetical protein
MTPMTHPAQTPMTHPAQTPMTHPAQTPLVNPAQTPLSDPAQTPLDHLAQTIGPKVFPLPQGAGTVSRAHTDEALGWHLVGPKYRPKCPKPFSHKNSLCSS